MGMPHPLPDALVERIAERFRVLGEPLRIRIVEHLMAGEATVQELTDALGSSQQNVSKHLRLLATAGIVGRRKQGNYAYYRIVDASVEALCEQVCGAVQREIADLSAAIDSAAGGAR